MPGWVDKQMTNQSIPGKLQSMGLVTAHRSAASATATKAKNRTIFLIVRAITKKEE